MDLTVIDLLQIVIVAITGLGVLFFQCDFKSETFYAFLN